MTIISFDMYHICINQNFFFWFSSNIPQIEMPHPKSGVHLAVSRTRLGQMNDSDYNAKLFQAADEIILKQNPQRILVLSEQTFLPLILASKLKKNTKAQIICYELNHHFKDFLEGI